jgi:membrane protein required for colicin V production
MESLGWVDLAMLGVLLLSLALGLWRGFVLEALALAGWVVAYFTAQWLGPQWAPHLPLGEPESNVNQLAGFAAAFLAVLIGWGLASRLVRALTHATPLRGADRVLGAAFGLLRGVLLLLLATLGIALTPASTSPQWHRSQGAQWLTVALRELKPLLPPDIAQLLPA